MPNESQPSLMECDPDAQQIIDDMMDQSVDFEDLEELPDEEERSQHGMHEESEDPQQSPKEMETEVCQHNASVTPMFKIVGDNIDRKVLKPHWMGKFVSCFTM